MKISTFLRDMRNSTLIAGLLLLALSATAGPVPTDSVVPADQWQQAQTVSSFPFTTTLNSTTIPLNNDYNLPPTDIADGPDVVYKLIFNQDTYLNASVTSGENGKVALYPEGFKFLLEILKAFSSLLNEVVIIFFLGRFDHYFDIVK